MVLDEFLGCPQLVTSVCDRDVHEIAAQSREPLGCNHMRREPSEVRCYVESKTLGDWKKHSISIRGRALAVESKALGCSRALEMLRHRSAVRRGKLPARRTRLQQALKT